MESFSLHLAQFSTEHEASLRECTGLEVSRKLVNQFSADGFVTASEPILTRLLESWWLFLLQVCISLVCFPQFFNSLLYHQIFISGLAQDTEKSKGDAIDDAQVGFLKGAGRIHTAIALVIYLWRRGDKVGVVWNSTNLPIISKSFKPLKSKWAMSIVIWN